MGTQLDFLSYLCPDMSVEIFTRLNDPSDIGNVSDVSRSWQDFVIANSVAKHLCLRMFPQLSRVVHVVEPAPKAESSVAVGSSTMEWEILKKEHDAYALLAERFMSEEEKCISEAIIASSINRSQTLTYKLVADLCVVTEIRIKPFSDYAHWDSPTLYAAESFRFRMGHLNHYNDNSWDESRPDSVGDKFVWNYTSLEFPMIQEHRWQSFKFPEPVLCIGGIFLQIELREVDGLFARQDRYFRSISW
ncbi:hypothetical protein SLA2020_188110 [Shorea laevis]